MGFGPPTTVPTALFGSVPVTEAFRTPWLRKLAGLAIEFTATVCPIVNCDVTDSGAGAELLEELLLDPELELLEEVPLLLVLVLPETVCPDCGMSALLELKTTKVPYAGAVCAGAVVNPHGTGFGPSPVIGIEIVPPV
jgi:hypothetical protein